MRIKGQKISGPNEEYIVFPRGNNEPIVLTARAVLDMGDFDRLCPRPTPPIIRMKSGDRIEDLKDAKYQAKLEDYSSKRMAYLVLKSLEATEELEWETVQLHDPSTWLNYQSELKNSGFSDIEVNRIIVGVMNANCLNDAKLEEARKTFLAGLADRNGSSSHPGDPSITQSGEPVND